MTAKKTRSARAKTALRKRRPYRRDQILESSADLFHTQGFHATGMDDIGAAAGITGPGVYRHFDGKQEILDTLVRPAVEQALERARRIVEEAASPRDALDGLIGAFVDGLLNNRSVSSLVQRERRNLTPETRSWVERAERLHVEEWVHVLSQLRPELSDAKARTMVHAALWLCLSVAYYESGLDVATEAALLRNMTEACLLCDGEAR